MAILYLKVSILYLHFNIKYMFLIYILGKFQETRIKFKNRVTNKC